MQKLKRGELSVADLTVKNAVDFLHALAARGVRLYLASGTDQADVERETEALGYRSLFADRIFGAVGDATKEAKRIVLERIMDSIGADAQDTDPHVRRWTGGDAGDAQTGRVCRGGRQR